MNKTVTVNISGAIFNIEEEAYNSLVRYINSIKLAFKGTEGAEEIVADIESRIAELFQQKLSEKKQVITSSDVEEIVAIMGAPEDYSEAANEHEEPHTGSTYSSQSRNANRKFFRDPDDHLLGGVCSGISHFFGVDPLWIRLAFVLFTLAWGGGLVAYIVLWIIIPEASNTAEKLQMKGEDVTIDNIRRSVNESAEKVKEGFQDVKSSFQEAQKPAAASLKNFLEQMFTHLGDALTFIGKILVRIIGVLFILFSVVMFFGMIFGFIATDTILFDHAHLQWSEIADIIFLGESHMTLAIIAALLILAVPLIGIFYTGTRMLGIIKVQARGFSLSLLALFVLGLIIAGIVGVQFGQDFQYHHESSKRIVLDNSIDSIQVNVLQDHYFHNEIDNSRAEFFELVKIDKDKVIYGKPVHLYIRTAASDEFEVEVYKSAQGATQQKAIERTERMDYEWAVNDSTGVVDLSPIFSAPRDDHFRDQEIEIVVRVPEGKVISFNDNVERIYSRRSRSGRTFRMGDDELELLN